MYNKLLQRQIQKHFGDEEPPDKLSDLFSRISASYDYYEQDRMMLERSIEISSAEMIELNHSQRKALKELKTLFDNIEEAFFSISIPDYKLLQMSPACENIYGYPVTDFQTNSKLWYEVVLAEDKIIIDNNYPTLITGKSFAQEYRIHHKDGTIRWVETKISPTLDGENNLTRIDGVTVDITQRKKAEFELERNIIELKKSNSELDKFVYSVSHDLRAPLSSMLGIIEISQDSTTDELMLEHLKMLRGNIKKLDGFIVDILDYSRNSRLEVKKERIHFKELLDDISTNLKYMGGNSRKVDIKMNVNENAHFYCDKSRLNIILNNLVSNAIRYQNANVSDPFVDVKINTSDTETDIIIQDNGIGIHKEQHQKIFDMFYRVSEESVGSGLGLYIVKEAVNKLNGNIEVQSEVGEGSAFIIKIPNI